MFSGFGSIQHDIVNVMEVFIMDLRMLMLAFLNCLVIIFYAVNRLEPTTARKKRMGKPGDAGAGEDGARALDKVGAGPRVGVAGR